MWAPIEQEVRRRHRVRTVVYDRAGLGRSAPGAPPYRIDDEGTALRRELDRNGIPAPVVLVAHSYGGFVATLVAATDERIAGLVLVDANLARSFDDSRVERLLAEYTPQFAELEQAAPHLARVLVPLMRAYKDTVARLREVDVPASTPTVDIVAERTWVTAPDDVEATRRAHAEFVAASAHRQAVLAHGSGHHVMRDRPDVVLDAIAGVIESVRSSPPGRPVGC